MLRVGLTGGIGAGKGEVARRLAGYGALVIDADQVAREVVAPGTPGLDEVIAAFGSQVLRPDGSLDRALLGEIVFSDAALRGKLNAIVHPLVGVRMREIEETAGPGTSSSTRYRCSRRTAWRAPSMWWWSSTLYRRCRWSGWSAPAA